MVAVRASSVNGYSTNTDGNNLVMTVPTGTLKGDAMVLCWHCNDYNPVTPFFPLTDTMHDKWKQMEPVTTGNGASSPQADRVFFKNASQDDEDNAGTKTYTITHTSNVHQAGDLIVMTGPYEWGQFAETVPTGTSTTAVAPSVTTTVANEVVFYVANGDQTGHFSGTPGSTTLITSTNDDYGPAGAAGASAATVWFEKASAGASGTGTFTQSSAARQAYTFSLRPITVVRNDHFKEATFNSWQTDGSGNSVTLTIPTDTLEGDFMVAILQSADYVGLTITPPSGWTAPTFSPIQGNAAASPEGEWVYWRVATAADETNAGTGTHVWAFSGAEEQAGLLMLFHPSKWGQEAKTVPTGTATTAVAPSVTTTVKNEIGVFVGSMDGTVMFADYPDGRFIMNDWVGPAGDSGSSLCVMYDIFPNAAATGTKTFVLASNERQAFMFSIVPTPIVKEYNGASWDDVITLVWDGTYWLETRPKVYDGTDWV